MIPQSEGVQATRINAKHDTNGQIEAQMERKDLLVRFREYLTESHGEPPTLDDDWEYEHGLIAEIDRVLER